MAHMKPEILFSRCARIMLMLDEGKYNRTQMAAALNISVPTVARYLALFRDKFKVKIDFKVDPAGQAGVARARGRSGSLYIADYGLVKRSKAMRLCRAFLRSANPGTEPDNSDLFKFLCCYPEEELPALAKPYQKAEQQAEQQPEQQAEQQPEQQAEQKNE
jgi:hypothetical protein